MLPRKPISGKKMLSRLLEYAEHHELVVGVRVRPVSEGFAVSIWIGPSAGDRNEWQMEFPQSETRMGGIDQVAKLALRAFRRDDQS